LGARRLTAHRVYRFQCRADDGGTVGLGEGGTREAKEQQRKLQFEGTHHSPVYAVVERDNVIILQILLCVSD